MGRCALGHRVITITSSTVSSILKPLHQLKQTFLTDEAGGSALSRSGKKVLHVDKNEYYGGTEAALSLQEIEAWVDKVNAGRPAK